MKLNQIYVLPLLVLIFSACSNPKQPTGDGATDANQDVETKARNTIKQFDASSINIFKTWHYDSRGETKIWHKLPGDSYACYYLKIADTVRISVSQLGLFNKDFPYSFAIDSNKYRRVSFSEFNGNSVKILATDAQGKPHVLTANVPVKDLFKGNDPFKTFAPLASLTDNLGITGSYYHPEIGNFVEFYLSYQHVLTYMPDSLYLRPDIKDGWLKEFAKGKMLDKHWDLRELKR